MPSKIHYCFKGDYTRRTIREMNVIKIEEVNAVDLPVKFNAKSLDGLEAFESSIKAIKKLGTTWKETYLVQLSSEFDHYPCDAVGIYAPNSDELVDRIFELCGFQDRYIKIERNGAHSFTFEGKLSYFIKYKLDLTTLPKKAMIMRLSRTAKMNRELEYLCSMEGTSDYLSLGANWNTLVDIIEEFVSVPTLEDLLINCDLIKPRYYTLLDKKSNILIGIISKNIGGELVFGHVSKFIKSLHDSSTVAGSQQVVDAPINVPIEICFRRNKLFDQICSKNLICFCTGTGIAPYIAFNRYRSDGDGTSITKLVYGFRNDEDNILRYFDIDGHCVEIKSSNKDYIQGHIDIIEQHKDDCSIFICGNMKVQRAVFVKIQERYPGLVQDKKIFFDNWQ